MFGVNGSQRHQGIELSVFGQPIESVRIIGGMTLLDPKMRRTGNPAIDGNDPVGVPQFQINVNVEWDVPFLPGLTLDGRVVHTGTMAELARDETLQHRLLGLSLDTHQ